MKILVLSDSHSSLHYMRQTVESVKPDAVVHLGDYYDDGQTLHEEYPNIPFFAVPGNCDQYRGWISEPGTKTITLGGVKIMMTHGHYHHVKSGLDYLIRDAENSKVQMVLFGHTHIPYCKQESSGLWVLNPGSCGYGGGSAGLIEVDGGKVLSCSLL